MLPLFSVQLFKVAEQVYWKLNILKVFLFLANERVTMQFATRLQLAAALKNARGRGPQEEDINALRDVLFLVRHGERLDHVNRAYKGDDPPLSPVGRLQALETALFFRALQRDSKLEVRIKGLLSVIVSSPFHRCIETAVIINVVGFGGSLPLFINPLLSDWMQTKVFRVSPNLRGYYEYGTNNNESSFKNINYNPDIASLQADLPLFLESFTKDSEFLKANSLQPRVVKEWVQHLNSWCDARSRIPVWTSPPALNQLQLGLDDCIKTKLERDMDSQRLSTKEERKKNEEGKYRNTRHFNSCGISFPENRRGLLERCEELMSFLFNFHSTVKPWYLHIPSSIIAAAQNEKKTNLPSTWKAVNDLSLPASNNSGNSSVSSFQSLLPPVHVLCVTHADVVCGIVESTCPKQNLSSFVPVPYCSMTILHRHNNFYRVELHGQSKQKARGRKDFSKTQFRPKNDGEASSTKNVQEEGTETSSSEPLNWVLEEFASLKALNTKIVLRYC